MIILKAAFFLIMMWIKLNTAMSIETNNTIPRNLGGCEWSIFVDCSLKCFASASSQLNSILETLYNETINCHESGLILELSNNIFHGNLPWFNARIKIIEFKMGVLLSQLPPGTFVADAFSTVEIVTLDSYFNTLNTDALLGFNSIRELHFIGCSIPTIEPRILDPLAETLETFTFTNTQFNSPINIDGLTGGQIPALQLKTVKMSGYVGNRLTQKSFQALTHIKSLDLTKLQLSIIPTGAFDPISHTIEELKINSNKLINFPVGLFDQMYYRREYIEIYVDSNTWTCNCDLCYTRWLLRNGFKFNTSLATTTTTTPMQCNLPTSLRGQNITDAQFCLNSETEEDDCPSYTMPEPPPPTTTSTTTTTTTTTTSPITKPPNNDEFINQKCYTDTDDSYEILPIRQSKYKLLITEINSGEITVEITPPTNDDHALLWYSTSNDDEEQQIDCKIPTTILSKTTQKVYINNLNVSSMYIFCLLQINASLSPFDCTVYSAKLTKDPQESPIIWLYDYQRPFMISMLIVGIILSILLGFLIGYIIFWVNPTFITGNWEGYQQNDQYKNGIMEISMPTNPLDINQCRKPSLAPSNYLDADTFSQFDIIKKQLEQEQSGNKVVVNHYYVERAPYVLAPEPPTPPPPPPTSTEQKQLQSLPLESLKNGLEASPGQLLNTDNNLDEKNEENNIIQRPGLPMPRNIQKSTRNINSTDGNESDSDNFYSEVGYIGGSIENCKTTNNEIDNGK